MIAQAVELYKTALKTGQKNHRECVIRGRYPYLQVLDEILTESMIAGQIELGHVEVPAELIVGTKAPGRKTAFSADFMPLLDYGTEFSLKWVELCSSHLEEGIRDAVKCYEYLGRFYVQEGNKRVSVLKSLGALSIPCSVTRIIPTYSDDPVIVAYYEFMQFYRLSHCYELRFERPGFYPKLQAALGFEADHRWTSDERKAIVARFMRFKAAFDKLNSDEAPADSCDAFLVWLKVYTLDEMKEMSDAQILKNLKRIWDDVLVQSHPDPIQVKTTEETDSGILNKIFGIGKVSKLNIAFIYDRSPADSNWTAAHDLGRQYLEKVMGSRLTVRTYVLQDPKDDAQALMEEAIADGADAIFATTPPLITACWKIAVKHPEVYILNCSVSMPYTGVRTYYSRVYEGKFITGAIAGAMAGSDTIGYVASYPILGVPASINAFALGAQMTNPRAKVVLHWSCTPGNCQDVFTRKGIRVISNRDVPSIMHPYEEWGTYEIHPDGALSPLASPYWDWGKFYEKMVRQILEGQWETESESGAKQAVNYWWGMKSDVIDVRLGNDLPEGVRQLAEILRQGVKDGTIDIFHRPIVSQDGTVRNDGSRWLSPEDILNMDWLCNNVEGSIPTFDQILPMSQSMVRLLGIYRDQIPPEKGAAIL